MCDCDINTTNQPETTTYSISNVGGGNGLYAGAVFLGNNIEFTFKSLLAGSGITLTPSPTGLTITSTSGVSILNNLGTGLAIGASIVGNTLNLKTLIAGANMLLTPTANDITISSTITPITSVTNLGTGEPVLVDILGNSVRARSLIGVNGLSINNLGNELQLSDDQIQSLTNVITYNYGKIQSVDLSLSYNSPTGVVSNSVPICEYTAGNISSTGLTTLDYIPGARVTEALVLPFQTTANNGTTLNSEVKLFPNTLGACNYINEYLLYTNSAGEISQINVLNNTERLMVDYNGSNLSFTAQFIAMDIADNLLFYVRNPSDNFIRYYDFSTGNNDKLIEFTSLPTWSGNFVNMYFDQDAKVLYLLSDEYKFLRISVKPFDRNYGLYIPMGMPSMVTNIPATPITQYSFCIDNGSKVQFLVGDTGSRTKLWQISNPLGAVPFYAEYQNDLESVSNGYAVEFGASGRLYIGSQDSKRLYRFDINQDVLSSPTSLFSLNSSPTCLTRSPYGIIF